LFGSICSSIGITFNKPVENYINHWDYQMFSKNFETPTQDLIHITLHLENVLGYLWFLCLQVAAKVVLKKEKEKENS
jgi:hypothetical protein